MHSKSIAKIRQEIVEHKSNAWANELGYEPVFTASESSKIVIVGQAPGRRAQESRIPWNDPSGVTLRIWMGIDRETFYDSSQIALIPMDFYFPGKGAHGDLPPRPEFGPLWHPRILKNMPQVELIILAGAYAQKYYLAESRKANLTETVRAFQEYGPLYFPIVHPSPLNRRWLTQNPWFLQQVVPQLRRRVTEIIRPQ